MSEDTKTQIDEPVIQSANPPHASARMIAILAGLLSVLALLVAGFTASQLYRQYRPLLGQTSQWQRSETDLADQLQQYQTRPV